MYFGEWDLSYFHLNRCEDNNLHLIALMSGRSSRNGNEISCVNTFLWRGLIRPCGRKVLLCIQASSLASLSVRGAKAGFSPQPHADTSAQTRQTNKQTAEFARDQICVVSKCYRRMHVYAQSMHVEFFQIKLADALLTLMDLLLCFSQPDVKYLGMMCRASGNDMSQCENRFITSDWKRASVRLHDTECERETLPKTQTLKLNTWVKADFTKTLLVLLSVIHQCSLFQQAKTSHSVPLIMFGFLSDLTYLFSFPLNNELWV